MEIRFKNLKPMTEAPKEDGWYFVVRLAENDLFDISNIHFMVCHGWNTWRGIHDEVHEEMRMWDIETDPEAFWTKEMERL